MTKLVPRILELICEGLGLESGYFEGKLGEVTSLSVNHYPPCPDPSLALGLSKHCDPNLITILLQDDVCGLQIFKDNEWIGVDPVPNAFVVNIGYQLQVHLDRIYNKSVLIIVFYHKKSNVQSDLKSIKQFSGLYFLKNLWWCCAIDYEQQQAEKC